MSNKKELSMTKSNHCLLLFYCPLDWCRNLEPAVAALREGAEKYRCDGRRIHEYRDSSEAFQCGQTGDKNASAMCFCSKPTAETVAKLIKFHRSERQGDFQYDPQNSAVLGCFIDNNSPEASEFALRAASEAIERILYRGPEYFANATVIKASSGWLILTCDPEKAIKTLVKNL